MIEKIETHPRQPFYKMAAQMVISFSAIGDYSRPSGRPLLSTLVDITSCNDVIKTVALRCQYNSMQMKQYIYLIHINPWKCLRGFFKVIISISCLLSRKISHVIILSVKIFSALA